MTPSPTFDGLAPYYQLLERAAFGSRLLQCRLAHLHRLNGCTRALVLGDGDGRFLAELLHAHPRLHADSIDLSPRMIALAKRRIEAIPGTAGRIRFTIGDARTLLWPQTNYDLVVTNFFLDCFPARELAALVDRIASACTPSAMWLDGDFRMPRSGWSRPASRFLLAAMYAAFRIATGLRTRTLIDPAPFLSARGFRLVGEAVWLNGFLTSRLWVRE